MRDRYLEQEIYIARKPAEVFEAWATADALAMWFAPMAIESPEVDLDFKVGGRYVIRMKLPDNTIFTTTGLFREIVPNRKIVMSWHCDAYPDAETLVTVAFDEDRGGTTVRLKHERFEVDGTRDNHRDGWRLCLASLKAVLEAP